MLKDSQEMYDILAQPIWTCNTSSNSIMIVVCNASSLYNQKIMHLKYRINSVSS